MCRARTASGFTLLLLVPVITLLSIPLTVEAADPAPGPDPTDKSSRPATGDPVTGDMPMFAVPSDVFRELSEEAEHHFQRAREELDRGDRAHAATDVRKGASFFKLEAARGHAEDARRLKDEAVALEALSGRLAMGVPAPTADELTEAFGRADLLLARHHVERLELDWKDHDTASTAEDILAARHHLLAAREWRSHTAPSDVVAGYARAASLADRMGQPIGWTPSEVDSILVFFMDELARIESGS